MKVTVAKTTRSDPFIHESVPTDHVLCFEFHLADGSVMRISTKENDSVLDINGDGMISIEPKAANTVWIRAK